MFYVYILQSGKDNSYYVGYSEDVERRLEKHNTARRGYTATKQPWQIVYTEGFETKTAALKREKYIKAQKSRVFIEQLIKESAK